MISSIMLIGWLVLIFLRKLPKEYLKYRANALKNASYKSVNDAVDGLFGETLTVIVKKAEEKGFFARLVEMLKGWF